MFNRISAVSNACLPSSPPPTTSIITGLHRVWKHREKTDAEHDDAVCLPPSYTARRHNTSSTSGDPVADACARLRYVLRLARLQLAVLSFTLAIATYTFQAPNHVFLLFVLGGLVAIGDVVPVSLARLSMRK
jgi:hypothetical protein